MNKSKYFFIIAFIFVLTLRFFSFREIDGTLEGRLVQLTAILMFVITVYKLNEINKDGRTLKSYKYVWFFYLYPFFTSVICLLYHNQSLFQSFQSLLPHWFISIYFILILLKIPPKKVIQLIIICSLIRTGLTLIEQFTYPDVPFAFRMDRYDDETNQFVAVEVRNGFYRYLISDAYFLPLFSAIYSFIKYMAKRDLKYILIFLFSCLGIYMDQTRQVMISLALCLCLIPFVDAKKRRMRYIMLFLVLAAIMSANFDIWFGEALNRTRDDATESNIRVIAYTYFFENTGDVITSLFGNGLSYAKSTYGLEITRLQDLGLYLVDIGIVGIIYVLGYFFVAIFALYYLFVIFKNWKSIDSYLRVFMISILINSPLIFPLYNGTLPCFECFIGMIMYLIDKSILKNSINYNIKS